MTVERIERSHWRAEPKVKILEPGYKELVIDSFGVQKVLTVNTPDSVTVTTRIQDLRYSHTYEGEKIDKAIKEGDLRWFRGLAALNLVIGKRVAFDWKPGNFTSEPSKS